MGCDNGKLCEAPDLPLIPSDMPPEGRDLLQVNAGDLQYAKQACLTLMIFKATALTALPETGRQITESGRE